jgi:uncharacterized repeat protein (TIGR04138 family)
MDFQEKVAQIIRRDPRYKPDAYEFVMQALWFTQKKFKIEGHVNGRHLLEGIKEFGLQQYGPMAKTVFEHWGINTTEDFGQIVFNMVNQGLMSKTEEDSLEDFKNVYEFKEAFDIFKTIEEPKP